MLAALALGFGPAHSANPDGELLWKVGAVAGGGWLPDFLPPARTAFAPGTSLGDLSWRDLLGRRSGAARGIVYDDRRIGMDLAQS